MARVAPTVRVAAAVLSAALFTAMPALAQGQPERGQRQPERQDRGPGGGGGPGGGMMRGMGGMGGGMGQMFEAPITTRDLQSYSTILELTAEQRETLDVLLEAHQQEFNEKAGEARKKLEALREEARENRDPDVWRDMGTQMETFRKARQSMETSFFNDVKAVLTPEQSQKFPKIERQRRREQTIGFGLMSGERIDLVRVAADLKLPAEEFSPLQPVLDQYETDLDRELQNRNTVYEENQGKVRELFESGATDEVQKVLEKGREASTRVREVNRRYARQLESLLAEEPRERFAEQVRRESFPGIYRPSYASRVVDAAAALEGLDDNQKSALTSIKENYTREATAINRQLEAATLKQEETLTAESLMSRGFRGGSEETEALRDKKRELDSTTADKVRAVLTPEQLEKLPRRDERQGGPGGGEQRRPQQRRGRDGEGEDAPAPRPNQRT